MGILILSLFFGTAIACGFFILIDAIVDNLGYEHKIEDGVGRIILIIATFVIVILATIGMFTVFKYEVNNTLETEINEFKIIKVTYEDALNNSELSGFERLQIVKNIADENRKLAKQKVVVLRWTRFDIRDDLKLQMLELEYINVS